MNMYVVFLREILGSNAKNKVTLVVNDIEDSMYIDATRNPAETTNAIFKYWIEYEDIYYNLENEISTYFINSLVLKEIESENSISSPNYYNFMLNLFTPLAQGYPIEKLNIKTLENTNGTKWYEGHEYRNTFFPYYERYLNDSPYSSSCSDVFFYVLLGIKEEIGWKPIKESFHNIINDAKNSRISDLPIMQKYNLFLDHLARNSNRNIHDMFTAREIEVLERRLEGTLGGDIDPTETEIYLDDIVFFENGMEETSVDYYNVYNKVTSINGFVDTEKELKSLEYEITIGKLVINSGILETKKEFALENIVLVEGVNALTVKAVTLEDKEISKTITIYNSSPDNSVNLNLDKADSDSDGLLNYEEDIYGTNKNNHDSDADSLTDFEEIFLTITNPLVADTDDNGTIDSEEDFDEDGLNNLKEVQNKGNPFLEDTDNDGLNDLKEFELGTKLDDEDSDDDKSNDSLEMKFGTNPLNPDSNGNGVLDGDEKYTVDFQSDEAFETDTVRASVVIKLKPEQYESLEVSRLTDTGYELTFNTPGYLGNAYDFSVDGEFDEATIKFEITPPDPLPENFDPKIFYYNRETKDLEELENQTFSNNTISAKTNHFSTYIALDKNTAEKEWNTYSTAAKGSVDVETSAMDVAFVIENNMNVKSLDEAKYREIGAKMIVNRLSESDRAAVITANSKATLLNGFTSDKNSIKSSIEQASVYTPYYYYKVTSESLNLALDQFSDDTSQKKYVIMFQIGVIPILKSGLTANYTPSSGIKALAAKANSKGVSIISIHLSGTYVYQPFIDDLTYLAEATNGKIYRHVLNPLKNIDSRVLINTYDQIITDLFYGTLISYTDKDSDGLWDYYELNGMRSNNGAIVFSDPTKKDTDGDGVPDGAEVVMKIDKASKRVLSFDIKSDPYLIDSDWDGYKDSTEINYYKTNPLVADKFLHYDDIELVRDGSYYYADVFQDNYETVISKQFLVGVGNKVYGNNYLDSELMKKALLDYFESISVKNPQEHEVLAYLDVFSEVGQILNSAAGSVVGELTHEHKIALSAYRESLKKYNSLLETVYSSHILDETAIGNCLSTITSNMNKLSASSQRIRYLLSKGLVFQDTTIKLFKNIDANSKAMEAVFIPFISFYDGLKDYSKFYNITNIMLDNLNTLDILIKNSKDIKLVMAANRLKAALLDDCDKKWYMLEQIPTEIAQNSASYYIGYLISKYSGWITLEQAILDSTLKISDTAAAAYQTYGVSLAAEILSNDFYNKIKKYKKTNTSAQEYIINDNFEEISKKLHNLTNMRILGEEKVIEMQTQSPKFIQKLRDLYPGAKTKTIIDTCNSNIEILTSIKNRIGKNLYKF